MYCMMMFEGDGQQNVSTKIILYPEETMIGYHGIDSTWRIHYTGSDDTLLDKMSELYEEGQDFVALAWQPSLYTAKMELIPINWEYNPSGTLWNNTSIQKVLLSNPIGMLLLSNIIL